MLLCKICVRKYYGTGAERRYYDKCANVSTPTLQGEHGLYSTLPVPVVYYT
jgi:hypothetical protein